MTATAGFVKAITCRSCKGTGEFMRASGMPDTCGSCLGVGKVEGDKATNAAYKARIDAVDAAYDAMREGCGRQSYKGKWTLGVLQANEPERYSKALESLRNGHPKVIEALIAYYDEHHAYNR